MIRFLSIILCCSLGFGLQARAGDGSVPPVDFNRDVRPIFNQHCVACHGGVKQAGGLSFVYSDSVLDLIDPGSWEDSYLLERVLLPVDDDEHMPPIEHGRALNEAEIDVLKRWIDGGGEWGKHWAFLVPELGEVPEIDSDDWSRTRTDRFVLDKMKQHGLSPQVEAAPEKWLRRASLDLIGLPPTPDQVDAFLLRVSRDGEDAYRAATEDLLASPAFGERWASVWLDVIRYADSRGLGIDGRRTIWQFRDWVIRAFNDDMPYDAFTVRQLAGDLLPDRTLDDLLATACHRTTQTNEEGGTDDETFRTEAVMDRVNTTWQAWQGLSFGCVQCHSHPYDPIEHKEYYEFLAFFNNTADSDLGNDLPTLAVPADPGQYDHAFQLDQQADALWQAEWQLARALVRDDQNWKPISDLQLSTNNNTRVVAKTVDGIEEYQTTGTVQTKTRVHINAGIDQSIDQITALRFTGFPEDQQQALVDSEWGFIVSHLTAKLVSADGTETEIQFQKVISDEPHPLLDPDESLNAKSTQGFGPYSRIHHPRSGAFLADPPVSVKAGDRLKMEIVFNDVELGAFPLIAHRGRIAVSDSAGFTEWLTAPARVAARDKIAALRNQRSKIRSINTPIFLERFSEFARPSRVFDRGNQMTKTDPVAPAIPQFLASSSAESSSSESKATLTRLDMARWLVSPENPLTARVAVNRFWAQLFGTGIVETQEDFGIAGAPPTHPELLDDLAVRFRTEMGWSVKTLLRELVLSATYRQRGQTDSQRQQIDPSGQWLSRGPRIRLPAETIRDQALFIAGLLSDKRFGPPVHPPIPEGVWNPFQGGDKWATVGKDDPDRYRRTVYTYTKRTIPYPMMASFDAPSREFCSVRRLPSNTPTQALMTLNDATFVEAAEAFAGRMIAADDALEKQLRYGFRLATCRLPEKAELDAITELYHSVLKLDAGEKPAAEQPTGEDSAEAKGDAHAAMTTVASVLLNLDEVLTK
ncbi:Planctomycete cytochrome C [Stieleria maiorica]|uniref:Planctomycete cytochrome C n=1 Tax=Stieleria maiorica TaxID=2795974 RepID=A0A5B9MH43_9BACT|nr:PSD1 and planctomycete cytochrome C domain-containing protein [Stieleria maiorica]QEF99300.1 Planctomycete cytochrome C [Stieleria maiorica]